MFALRWNDKEQNSLRIDSSITDGVEVETKTEAALLPCGFPLLLRRNSNGGARRAQTAILTLLSSRRDAARLSTPTIFCSES
jgi:hypothetical protein